MAKKIKIKKESKKEPKFQRSYKYLPQEESEFSQRRKEIQNIRNERAILEREKKSEFYETPTGQVVKFLQKKPVRTLVPSKKRINFLQKLNPVPALSREQEMFQEVFSGEGAIMNGDGSCLPSTNNGNLGTQEFGGQGETGEMFGIKRYGFLGGY
jgi:hypothetical protein